jgi:hypothetical protein
LCASRQTSSIAAGARQAECHFIDKRDPIRRDSLSHRENPDLAKGEGRKKGLIRRRKKSSHHLFLTATSSKCGA